MLYWWYVQQKQWKLMVTRSTITATTGIAGLYFTFLVLSSKISQYFFTIFLEFQTTKISAKSKVMENIFNPTLTRLVLWTALISFTISFLNTPSPKLHHFLKKTIHEITYITSVSEHHSLLLNSFLNKRFSYSFTSVLNNPSPLPQFSGQP